MQLKTSESQFTVLASDEAENPAAPYANHTAVTVSGTVSGMLASQGMGGVGVGVGGGINPPAHRHVQHNTMSSRSSNGSVITLTMHNNHLIVEKEEIVVSDSLPLRGVFNA